MRSIVDRYMELYNSLYNKGIEKLDRKEVIELLKIDAIYTLAQAIKNHKEDK